MSFTSTPIKVGKYAIRLTYGNDTTNITEELLQELFSEFEGIFGVVIQELEINSAYVEVIAAEWMITRNRYGNNRIAKGPLMDMAVEPTEEITNWFLAVDRKLPYGCYSVNSDITK